MRRAAPRRQRHLRSAEGKGKERERRCGMRRRQAGEAVEAGGRQAGEAGGRRGRKRGKARHVSTAPQSADDDDAPRALFVHAAQRFSVLWPRLSVYDIIASASLRRLVARRRGAPRRPRRHLGRGQLHAAPSRLGCFPRSACIRECCFCFRTAEACCSAAFDSRANAWFALQPGELFPRADRATRPRPVPYSTLLLKKLAPSGAIAAATECTPQRSTPAASAAATTLCGCPDGCCN